MRNVDKLKHGLEVITDQSGDTSHIADNLLDFCEYYGILLPSPDIERLHAVANGTALEDEDYEIIEECIEEVNACLERYGAVGWHPDESGTLIYAETLWWEAVS